MRGKKKIEKIFRDHSLDDYKWIEPGKIVVAEWVRMKCRFGCDNYGEGACCPPNLPSVEECERFFLEYEECVIFHFEKTLSDPKKRRAWNAKTNKKMLEVEREVFLAGHEKAFVLFMGTCAFCKDCASTRTECKHKDWARPTPEGFAVDVYSTARSVGYPIEVVKDYDEKMNRYALLLVE